MRYITIICDNVKRVDEISKMSLGNGFTKHNIPVLELQSKIEIKDARIKELETKLGVEMLDNKLMTQRLEVLTKCTCTTHDLNIGDDCIGCHNKKLIEGEK